MLEGKAVRWTVAGGWLLSALVVGWIALLLVPDTNRTARFWSLLGWTQVLIFIAWAGTAFSLFLPDKGRDHVTRLGAIAPSLAWTAITYAGSSFVVLLIYVLLPVTGMGNRVHLVVQIVLLALAGMRVVVLMIARAGATAGLVFDTQAASTPRQLHDLLVSFESDMPRDLTGAHVLRARLKRLREFLLYSLSETESLGRSETYQSLSRDIGALCDGDPWRGSMSQPAGDDAAVADRVTELSQRIEDMTSNIQEIANEVKRR